LATVLPLNATVDGLADALAGSDAMTAGAVEDIEPVVGGVGVAAGGT
jgi:hypothetical protein